MPDDAGLNKMRVEALTSGETTSRDHAEKVVHSSDPHETPRALHCRSCASQNVVTVRGEIAMRLPGLKNIDVPIVRVFREIVACLDCATAQFAVPESELHLLAKREAAAGYGTSAPEFDEEARDLSAHKVPHKAGFQAKSSTAPR